MTRLATGGAGERPSALTSSNPAKSTPSSSGESGSRPGSSSSSTGWLSGSGAIDHGRFEPGTILGSRYRIVGRVGRGGMGEVYRADDLKLGQPVALKFLPPEVDRDPARLTQLHTEVRMARVVSHPNVCRVYDIDEVDGNTFLSMEFVDGEDLSALLRRIGRFPEERGLEIARQICAGLAAAHERDVIHRDFKPANVMLDAAGKVRITDFGLAGVTGEAVRAGTPAYMAPEQLAGSEVTARSDIYALGLVLYELFTGRRALEGKNVAELIRKREQSGIARPSSIVPGLGHDIEAAIMVCLRPEPDERPASALVVAAALPGGDPLAAALAAGETPSPEMVAAAGGTEAVSMRTTMLTAAWIVLSLLAILVLYQRVMMINRIATPKTPEALEDRAVEALAKLGYTDPPPATARGIVPSLDFVNYIDANSSAPNRWDLLRRERPETLVFWRRTSPAPLVPFGFTNPVSTQNPPRTLSGMTLTVVDASGRLGEFLAIPQPSEDGAAHPPPDWKPLFDAAGLDMGAFTSVAPAVVPPVYANQRAAWEGRMPELPEHVFRIEAGSQAGRPVYFVIKGPWTRSARSGSRPVSRWNAVLGTITELVMPGLMLAGALLARRNLKLGRGDRTGALRAATFVFIALMITWLLRPHVSPLGRDIDRMFGNMGSALYAAGLLWVTYLGLEPFVRRNSPDSLIGWTRLVAGGWNDPRVGRDVMIGVSAGLAMTLFYGVHNLIPPLVGWPEPRPISMNWDLLLGTREVAAYLIGRLVDAVQGAMFCVVGYVGFLLLFKRRWAAALAAIVCYTPVAIEGMFPDGYRMLQVILGVGLMSVFVFTIVRFGVLATAAALATHFVLLRAPLTTDFSSWRGPIGLWFLGTVALLGLGACYIARNGAAARQPIGRAYAPQAG